MSASLAYEVCRLCIQKEHDIDSKIRRDAQTIQTAQEAFTMLNRLAALAHKDVDSPEAKDLMQRLQQREITFPDPSNKEAFNHMLMTHTEAVKFPIQEKINSMHPHIVEKSGLIQMMGNTIKLDLGVKKSVDNQVPR